MSSDLTIKLGEGNWDKFSNIIFTGILIILCVVLVQVLFISAGMSPLDYKKNEMLYNTGGMLLGLLLSQVFIRLHTKELMNKYKRGSI